MVNLQTFHPQRMKDQSRIDTKLLAYCRNWGVDVEIINDNDFDIMLSSFFLEKANAFSKNYNIKYKRFFTNPTLRIGYDIKPTYFVNEPDTNQPARICISENFSNNVGSHICFQLALIQLKIKQSILNPYKSPHFFMYYKNMILNDVKVKLISDAEMQNEFLKTGTIKRSKNYKTFEEYILYGNKILINNGLINKDGTATFVNNKVKHKVNWFSNNHYEEYTIHYDKLFNAKYKASLSWNNESK